MDSRKQFKSEHARLHRTVAACGLAFAATAGLYAATSLCSLHAQSTVGGIFGQGPAGATVTVHGMTGTRRHTTIRDDGRYSIRSLPLSVYTVSLEKNGKDVDTRKNIPVSVGRGAEVDFACPNDQCTRPANK